MPVNPFSTSRAQQHDAMISIVAGAGELALLLDCVMPSSICNGGSFDGSHASVGICVVAAPVTSMPRAGTRRVAFPRGTRGNHQSVFR
ncbi:hypothetical protein SAMN05216309_1072 [Nitrosomonas europaea]|nr:hypothetical protein SAMN05216310_1072 [Nitrosomonas europaea]SES85666.1 hypothetical protein SAMN05216309_1072 [Nitrosomonas europaea]SJZ39287.1 hypothetical protein SAMN02745113_00774 [Nitrosomonas europaea]